MQPQDPARGISLLSDNDSYKHYRLHCDCTDDSHSVDTFIEVESDKEINTVTVTFFVNTWNPIYKNFLDRLKAAWSILISGRYEQQHDIVLNKQAALNFSSAISNSVHQLLNKDK
jgi:hypothetical protein